MMSGLSELTGAGLGGLILIGSLLGSVLLSVVSNLLTPFFERFVTKFLGGRRAISRKKRLLRRHKIIELANSTLRLTHTRANAMQIYAGSIWSLLLVILMQLVRSSAPPFGLALDLLVTFAQIGLGIVSYLTNLIAWRLFDQCGTAEEMLLAIADHEEKQGGRLQGEEREAFLAHCDQRFFGVSAEDLRWQREFAAGTAAGNKPQ